MATKSKQRKNHKQKLQARKSRIEQEKYSAQKKQREMIMELIKKEQESGMFDNAQTINPINNGPSLDGPVIEGPAI